SNCQIENDKILKIIKDIVKEISEYIKNTDTKDSLKEKIAKRVEKFLSSEENKSIQNLFRYIDQLTEIIYDYAVYNCKIKREDARFILPHGRKTTIVVSGTLSWIKDFITKRTDPHAQWEIQKVANAMKYLLEKQNIEV
ncbi:FAD-dependent thymidylate synthase, partial [Hydrogenothermus marinus]